MRTILFRGKVSEIPNKVVIGYLVNENTINSTIVDSNSVSQYTGIEDKTGCRIFENDIIKLKDDEFYIIKYHDGAYMLYDVEDNYYKFYLGDIDSAHIEVIGVSYEV